MTKPKPVPVQDTLNYRFYLERLEDLSLLDRAIVTEDNDLAVPVGGKRRGGYVSTETGAAARRLVRQLGARPDEFPGVRLWPGGYGWVIEWGPEVDWRGDDAGHPEDYVAAGRLFGYSEAAIAAYGRKRAGQ